MVFEKGASSLKVDGTDERKFSVLVVDDDATIRKIHSKFLGKFPVDVQVAVNGKEAVDLYRSGAFFDLVLMDLEMPIMNGFEVCFPKKETSILYKNI
jgi:CheY-like chemotaxis protein